MFKTTCGVLLVLGALSASAAAQSVEYVYTTFDAKQCKHTKGKEVEDYGSWRCPGYGKLPVWLSAGDQRMYVTYGNWKKDDIATSQTLPGFNDVYRGTVEWRIEKSADGKSRPFATILRWNIITAADRENATGPITPSGRVLVVTRLGPGGVCHIGYVDARANPDANELARKLADERARTFKCGKDKPTVSGRAPDPDLFPGDPSSGLEQRPVSAAPPENHAGPNTPLSTPNGPLMTRQVAMAKSSAAKCLLEVEGKTYIDGTCDVSVIDAEGSFILTEKSRSPYFAYVIIDSDDKTTADGSWNKVRSATHAHAPLGSRTLRLKDGCWSNESAKVCWSK